MGVDVTTYRIRIGCCRHNVGTDVVSLSVNIDVPTMSSTAFKILFLLLAILCLLTKLQYNIEYVIDITLMCNTKVAVGTVYYIRCLTRTDVPFSERLIGAVVFIRLLLLAEGIEPNPGPTLQVWESISSKDVEHHSTWVFVTLLSIISVCVSYSRQLQFQHGDSTHEESSLLNTDDKDDTQYTVIPVCRLCRWISSTITYMSWASQTCSYLLGNKGAHMTNGNPHNKGDVTVDPIIALLDKQVHRSVGFIHLERLDEEDDARTEDGFYCHGTGFRVGDCYMMTAYHVLRDRIDFLIDNITFEANISRKMDINDLQSTLEMTQDKSVTIPRDVIKSFLKQNGTDIQLLLDLLGNNVSEKFKSRETDIWKKHCVVDFLDFANKATRFNIDWKIPFGCEERDLLILKLVKISSDQEIPPRLHLAEKYEEVEKKYIIRYMNDSESKIVVDKECKVFKDDRDLEKAVKTSLEWWTSNFPDKVNSIIYENCTKAHDTNTGRVILRAAASFEFGSSGSPIVYFNEHKYKGLVCVGMLYQRGFPTFYYKEKRFWDRRVQEKTGSPVKNDVLFEGCTTSQKLAELLLEHNKLDLKANIFDIKAMKRQFAIEQVTADIRRFGHYDHNFDELLAIQDVKTHKPSGDAKGDYQPTGDVTVDPIRALLDKEVHRSVGFIHLERLDEDDDARTEDGFYCHGTGFRVGDCYMMTAYHVLRDRIDFLIDNITFEANISRKMDINDLQSTLEMTQDKSVTTPRDVIKSFLKQNGTDIQRLLDLLGNNVSEKFKSCETDIWKKHCVVDFLDFENKATRFDIDWKIPFGCKERNLLILKLVKMTSDQEIPPRLHLAEKYEEVEKTYIIRYMNNSESKIVVDKECKVFTDDRDLEKAVKKSLEWWTSIFPLSDDVISYEGCTKAHDTNTGRVILRAAASFEYGSSGSPIVYFNEHEYKGLVCVGMLYQRGFPTFYYKEKREWDRRVQEKTGNPVKNDVLFEDCTTSQKLAELLLEHNKLDLKANIFNIKAMKRQFAIEQVIADIRRTGHYDHYFDKLLRIQDVKTHRPYGDAEGDYQPTAKDVKKREIKAGDKFEFELPTYLDFDRDQGDITNLPSKIDEISDMIEKLYPDLKYTIIPCRTCEQSSTKPVFIVYSQQFVRTEEKTLQGVTVLLKNPLIVDSEGFKVRSLESENIPQPSPEDVSVAKKIIENNSNQLWKSHTNLNAISISCLKSRNKGENIENKLCVVLLCSSKSLIPCREEAFPKKLEFEGSTIDVDVREGYFMFGAGGNYPTHHSNNRHTPLKMGCCIGEEQRDFCGTLGPFVDLGNGKIGFLTCAHVLFDIQNDFLDFNYPINGHRNIVQPATSTAGQVNNGLCGIVIKALFDPNRVVSIDAAVVEIVDASRVPVAGHFALDNLQKHREQGFKVMPSFDNGTVRHYTTSFIENRQIVKFGCESHQTRGSLRSDGIEVRPLQEAKLKLTANSQREIPMKGQIGVEGIGRMFTEAGDSGSGVFVKDDDCTLHCIGMAIGRLSDGISVVTPIQDVLSALNIDNGLKKFEEGMQVG